MTVRDARGREYRLIFRYGIAGANLMKYRQTRCYLVPRRARLPRRHDPTAELLEGAVVGSAVCSPDDRYVKSTGRDLALERMLFAFEAIASPEDAVAVRKQWGERSKPAAAPTEEQARPYGSPFSSYRHSSYHLPTW